MPVLSLFDHESYPLPKNLKRHLDILSRSYFTARMRNLDMFQDRNRRFHAFLTWYEGSNYCWIQPTKTMSYDTEVEYNRYIKRINKDGKENILGYFGKEAIRIGLDCVALYEADHHWYRAIVVSERVGDQWMVLFVDYGNVQWCNVEEIRKPIHEPECDHFHAPLQAVCCRLYNIIPTSHDNQDKIDMRLSDFYTKNCDKFLELIVRNIRPDYVVDCDLFVRNPGVIGPERLHRRNIGQSLVDEGLATFAEPIPSEEIPIKVEKTEDI